MVSNQCGAPEDIRHRARAAFAYFDKDRGNPMFMENAGGSQVPRCVIEAMRSYMLDSYIQLGAGYEISNRATEIVAQAHEVIKTFMNADGAGEVVLGPSTSQLLANLGETYRRSGQIVPGDEIIVHRACHEANAGPWVRLAKDTGATLKWWDFEKKPPFSSLFEDIEQLLTPRTKLLAVAHVSNLLGEVLDIEGLVQLVRSKVGGECIRVIVDGVAYAPHLPIDVSSWGVDWYAFSTYKTWGPHMGCLFGSTASFAELAEVGPNHYWIDRSNTPYKFELGGPSHEGCAGLVALPEFLRVLSGSLPEPSTANAPHTASGKLLSRSEVEAAFANAGQLEQPLQEKLIAYLCGKAGVLVFGPTDLSMTRRVPTVSFVCQGRKSADIVKELHKGGCACRNGHMYARRLLEELEDLLPGGVDDGVVRISLLHYNTLGEVERLIELLDGVL